MTDLDSDSRERDGPQLTIGADDWPSTVTDKIVSVISQIRSHTTDNVVRVARAAVYGLVALVVGVCLLVLLAIIAVRLADAYLPIGSGVGSATWAAHGFIGLLISIMGLSAWQARARSNKPLWMGMIINAALIIAVIFYGVIRALV